MTCSENSRANFLCDLHIGSPWRMNTFFRLDLIFNYLLDYGQFRFGLSDTFNVFFAFRATHYILLHPDCIFYGIFGIFEDCFQIGSQGIDIIFPIHSWVCSNRKAQKHRILPKAQQRERGIRQRGTSQFSCGLCSWGVGYLCSTFGSGSLVGVFLTRYRFRGITRSEYPPINEPPTSHNTLGAGNQRGLEWIKVSFEFPPVYHTASWYSIHVIHLSAPKADGMVYPAVHSAAHTSPRLQPFTFCFKSCFSFVHLFIYWLPLSSLFLACYQWSAYLVLSYHTFLIPV